jgi:hypothetical protein
VKRELGWARIELLPLNGGAELSQYLIEPLKFGEPLGAGRR